MSVQLPDEDGLSVPCPSGLSSTEWRESPLTGGLLAFKRLCGTCFPELSDVENLDVDDIPVDRVVRSTGEQAPAMHLHPADAPADHPLRDDVDTDVDPDADADVDDPDGEDDDPERCDQCDHYVSASLVASPEYKINLPCGCRIPVSVAGGEQQ